jgi:FtsH-binding integral membrane protein
MESLTTAVAARQDAAEDRRFLALVYGWMAAGLVVTGLVAFVTVSTPALLMLVLGNPPLCYGLLVAELAAVWAFGPIARRFSSTVALGIFFLYATLNGLTFSVLLLVYTATSVASTFFIAAGTFAAFGAYGATTTRDLGGVGRCMIMGLIGLLVAGVVNLFLRSDSVSWVTSLLGVIVFTGLTAYDTQKILATNVRGNEGTDDDRKEAVTGALILYLDFVNLFLALLRLLGRRR